MQFQALLHPDLGIQKTLVMSPTVGLLSCDNSLKALSKEGPLGTSQALHDESVALQVALSDGFMFHVGLSEGVKKLTLP